MQSSSAPATVGPTFVHSSREADVRRLVRKLDDGLAFDARRELAPHVHWRAQDETPIHRWYRYREGFSPGLIEALGLTGDLLDPFCGCGSIMVGAAQRRQRAVGIDVNPLAVFVARVKLHPLSPLELAGACEFAKSFPTSLAAVEQAEVPGLGIANKVFEPEIMETLLTIRALIARVPPDRTREFLLLGWLSIFESVGSYFKEGNGIKYRNKKRLKTGYVRRKEGEWQRERFGLDQTAFVIRAYASQLETMIRDEASRPAGQWDEQEIIEASALNLNGILDTRQFESVVFSPPYANRFDYFESMKVELWFGGFVQTYQDMLHLRKSSLRSHLGADLKQDFQETPGLEPLIDLMDPDASSSRMGVPDALRGYFDDMRQVLELIHQSLADGGRCCVVVGNSAYAGVIIPTDALLARLGLACGYRRARLLHVRHLTVAPQQRKVLDRLQRYMRETVVVLEK
ncbi:MAG: SAM-dependent methyltransferase [Gaiellaceae bacterium]